MARLARVVIPGIPLHVTQRGNFRQVVFESDSDRLVYLDLLHQYCRLHSLSVAGYCLMSNHVHLIVIPSQADSLFRALKLTHGRYAAYANARHAASGHLWQGRYYSCPLDQPHLWAALRYTELNPVRAAMVARADAWPWSSAAAHCAPAAAEGSLDMQLWRECWTPDRWRQFLGEARSGEEADAIRQNTHSGRPLGGADFVAGLEKSLGRRLAPGRGGRPPKSGGDTKQEILGFGER